MKTPDCGSLLDDDESAPTVAVNPAGRSPFLLLGDHAGKDIPRRLGTLGLARADRERHIAWDIGTRRLGELLAKSLDATFIHQRYSRLVIDCNRDTTAADAIPETSDGTVIPGNERLADEARMQRIEAIHAPYQRAIAAELSRRAADRHATIIVSLHSFTPVMAGKPRPWSIGVLYSDGDTRFAAALLDILAREMGEGVGDNEPYRMDETDHSIPRHAFASGLPYAELEIRQDLIGEPAGQERWCGIVGAALEDARRRIVR